MICWVLWVYSDFVLPVTLDWMCCLSGGRNRMVTDVVIWIDNFSQKYLTYKFMKV